ncbi:tripartite tricarboxylate transporter substrate binding protein [Comamonas testosteroni]|uniref:tripartite tricarboxylate transporter substrate binding protein n=1 Tax=Comamonas testosteroni TaxID=285 RepID=UPI00389A9A5A
MKSSTSLLVRMGGAMAALMTSFCALAQDPYPSKAITMVVPFPPGGAADVAARPVAEAMGRYLKQPIVIENKAGAGGGIGMAQVARAKPDGYTVLMALSSVVVLPEVDAILQRAPMYALSQLKPIARFTADPVVLVVRSNSPWKDFQQFSSALKASKGGYSYGSSGNYGTMHVPVEQMRSVIGGSLLHVPYTGASPAIVALLGGQVDFIATGPSTVAGHIQSGRLRALAQWGTGPVPTLPGVPTLTDMKVPVTYAQWTGLFAPASTPETTLAKLREAAKFAANDDRVKKSLQSAGTYLQYQDSAEFEKFVVHDADAMRKVVQHMGKID